MMIRRTLHRALMMLAIGLLSAADSGAQTVRIQAEPQQSVFVGTEPLKIRCVILVTTGVYVMESSLREVDVAPFILEAITIGERIAIPEKKDEAFIEAVLVIRPPEDLALGIYTFPALELKYSFTSVDISGMVAGKKTRYRVATTKPIELEKVSLYAETDLLHEVTRIGDENIAILDVHLDAGTTLYNDLPPETPLPDVTYLREPILKEPLVLLGVDRTERAYDTHQIVSYRYRFSVMDVPAKPVSVPFPPLHYGKRGGKQSEVQTKDIGSSHVRIVSVLDKDTTFEPMKGIFTDASWERYVFLWGPLGLLIVAGICFSGLSLHEAVTVFRAWRRKGKDEQQGEEELTFDLPQPVYERNLLRRLLLHRAADRALSTFNRSPNLKACSALRNRAARALASKSRERIGRQEACAMSVKDLERHCHGQRAERWLKVIASADEQVAHRRYVPIVLGDPVPEQK